MSLPFSSDDDILNQSSEAFQNISPLSARFSKFLQEYTKEEGNNAIGPWHKTRETIYNKGSNLMKASSSESCSGSLNTSLLGSQETSKHNYRENNLLRNQITLIRNNLKLLKSQVDFLIKFRSTETGGLVQQVRETLKNELESLLNWLEPIKSEDTILKRNRTLRRSPRLIERQKIKSPETSFKIPEKLSPTSLSELIEISNFVQEDGSKKKEDNFNEYNNLNVFMQKMENDFDYLTNEFKLLQKRVEAFEQLNWQELFNNFRVKIQEQTIKLCISYIIRDLDQDIFEA